MVIHHISRSHGLKNRWFQSNLSIITRPVAAIKSLRFALFTFFHIINNYALFAKYPDPLLLRRRSLNVFCWQGHKCLYTNTTHNISFSVNTCVSHAYSAAVAKLHFNLFIPFHVKMLMNSCRRHQSWNGLIDLLEEYQPLKIINTRDGCIVLSQA